MSGVTRARPCQGRWDGPLLLAPLVLFLLLTLGFPFATDLVYSVSDIQFTALWSPHWTGLANYAAVATDPVFWQALGFSLRFALIATAAEVALGFLLVLALSPLIERHRWLMALLVLPMMVSPALLGVMYRLMLNEFVGIVPQYLEMLGIRACVVDVDGDRARLADTSEVPCAPRLQPNRAIENGRTSRALRPRRISSAVSWPSSGPSV